VSGKKPKVAIVQDWLVVGGAERVVQELHRMFPDAPIYTSYCTDEWRKRLDNKVVTGFLQRWPFSKLRKFLPVLRIWWFSRLDLSQYDIVISSSGNGEALGVRTPSSTLHINYCHAPTHYYWGLYDQYLRRPGFGVFDPLARIGLRLLVGPLRAWDYRAAQRADVVLANSTHTQEDIRRYYQRESTVVFPPVDVERFNVPARQRHGFVIAGRQTPYKRFDLAVQACTQANLPLRVIGRGPEHDRLVAMAGPTVEFPANVTDEQMAEHFASAEAFLFPQLEDFGVTPAEALAAGTPLIAYHKGGALDMVDPGKTGIFFDEQTVSSLAHALQTFPTHRFNHAHIRAYAQRFSPASFRAQVQACIAAHYKEKP